ncbi:bacteriohemerythrin [Marinilabilia rubra]|uniref:Hemerythrin-like domain-containing protein n=1 Tax=Marinilabilia rubra TaxID=2162893 RepID=A0A2U2B4E5_9BACT|nr:hemerythrin family protein [Marinilabilia rubra]PWD97926.1 hypothetical protein DDZ16_18395 [Marinilabilia rubra]
MASIWSDNFSLNIPVIDNQHRKFFEIFEKVSKGYENKTSEELDALIGELEEYLEFHFEEEEKLMRESGYKWYEAHKKQHTFFISRIEEMRNEFDYLNPMLFNKIRVFIKKWFVSHILHKDFDYKEDVAGIAPDGN